VAVSITLWGLNDTGLTVNVLLYFNHQHFIVLWCACV